MENGKFLSIDYACQYRDLTQNFVFSAKFYKPIVIEPAG